MTFEELKQRSAEEWQRIRRHPMVIQIGKGTLDHALFRTFIEQDAIYLTDFSRVLARLASLAPDAEAARLMLRHADAVFQVEASLHQSVADSLGVDAEELGRGKTGLVTKAYTDHLVRAALEGAFRPALAAVMPCYWTYAAIGTELNDQGLPADPVFRDWVLTYSGPQYQASVAEVVALWARLAEPGEDGESATAFQWSMVYERLFWEQAYASMPFLSTRS